MTRLLEFILDLWDVLTSPESQEIFAGLAAVIGCVIAAEIILAIF